MKRSRKEKEQVVPAADVRGTPKQRKDPSISASVSESATKDGKKSWFEKCTKALKLMVQDVDGIPKFVLRENLNLWRSHLTKLFQKYPDVPDRFVSDVEQRCETDPVFLEMFLKPAAYQTQENDRLTDLMDSPFKMFLLSPLIQVPLLSWLIEKLPGEDGESDDSKKRVRLILNNLKYVTNLQDSSAFAKQMMDCLNACPATVQREIIVAIPEVIDDKGHLLTVETLQRLMEEDASFTVPILDTYSSLNLSASILDSVRDSLLKRLDSIPSAHLPSLITFLFQTIQPKSISVVVAHLRKDLNLTTDAVQSHVQSQHASTLLQKTLRAQDYQLLTLEAVHTAMAFDEKIGSSFLSAVSGDHDNSAFDVWIVLMAHGIAKLRPKVEALVRKKVMAREWTMRLMKRALGKHGDLLKTYFPAVMTLAERGVRSMDPLHIRFGCSLYSVAFGVFVQPFERQEVLSNVLAHIGSQNEAESAAGLDVLVEMARSPDQLKQFWSFLETILDQLYQFSRSNLRKAWAIFASLIWKDAKGDTTLLDEGVYGALDMVIRKQLGNVRHAYKLSGVVGAVSCLSEMAVERIGGKQKSKEANEQFAKVWNSLLQQCKDEPPYMAFAMDELAHAFHARAMVVYDGTDALRFGTLIETLSDHLLGLFDLFSIQIEPKARRDGLVGESALLFDLNGPAGAAAMDFWEFSDFRKRDQLMYLCPLFRAVQTIHRCRSADMILSDLDSLLGAPLLVYPPKIFDDFKDLPDEGQQRVCVSLFFAINWLREILNAYCDQPESGARQKVLQRLSDMHYLEKQLETCLRNVSGSTWTFLPDAHNPSAHLGDSAAPSSKKKAKTEKKSKESDAGSAPALDGPEDLIRVRSLKSRFRRIDLDAVKIFGYPSVVDSEAPCAWLRPFALHALISALHANCSVVLEPPKKLAPFGRKVAPPKESESHWAGHALSALEKVLLPVVPFLNENLQRLGQLLKGDEAEWAFEEDQVYDHEAAELPSEQSDDADNIAVRQKMEFWWYIVPAQRLLMEILERSLRWLHTASAKLSADEAKPYDQMAKSLFTSLAGGGPIFGQPASAGSGSAEVRKNAYNYLACFAPSIQTMPNAVAYCRLLEMVALFGVDRKFASLPLGTPDDPALEPPERALLNNLSNICDSFLRRQWSASAGGAKAAEVRSLLDMHLARAGQPSRAIGTVVEALEKLTGSEGVAPDSVPAAVDDEAGDVDALHTLSKSTLALFYKSAFLALNKVLKDIDFADHASWDDDLRRTHWTKLTRLNKLMANLISICKKKVPTQVYASVLREGKVYVEALTHALPFLGSLVHSEPNNVHKTLRFAQSGTRLMQSMCGTAKTSGEKVLLALVPAAKKALQKFVLEVRRMMDSAGLVKGLTMGSLKHKDLEGNILSSQVTYMVDQESDEGDADEDAAVAEVALEESEDSKGKGEADEPVRSRKIRGREPADEEEQEEEGEEEQDDEPVNSD